MKRNLIEKLLDWKQKKPYTPLFLSGMRGCGKTYLAMEFAKSFYEGMLYLNFEQKNAQGQALLAEVGQFHTMEDFVACICRIFDLPKEYLAHFLIILDEAYEERAVWDFIVSIAADCAKLPSCEAAGQTEVFSRKSVGNLLVLSSRMPALPKEFSQFVLYPLQFDEFLSAIGEEWYSEVIRGHFETNHRIPGIVHGELSDRFEDYLCTGGMPTAINEYLCFERTDNLPEIHQAYLGHILHKIGKQYGEGEALKMRQVLEVLPAQLNKNNPKFQYRLIRRGATQALFLGAIKELAKARLILLCTREDKKELFRAFPADSSLLYALAGEWKREKLPLRRPLLESYIMQTLCCCGYQPVFWESSSQARIDFLIEMDGVNIPVELKIEGNLHSKSIGIYQASHEIPYSFRICAHNFDFSNQVRTIPYYAAFCMG